MPDQKTKSTTKSTTEKTAEKNAIPGLGLFKGIWNAAGKASETVVGTLGTVVNGTVKGTGSVVTTLGSVVTESVQTGAGKAVVTTLSDVADKTVKSTGVVVDALGGVVNEAIKDTKIIGEKIVPPIITESLVFGFDALFNQATKTAASTLVAKHMLLPTGEHATSSHPYNRALIHMAKGQYCDAIADFEKVVKDDANNYQSIFKMGLCKLSLGNVENAATDFESAIGIMQKLTNGYKRRINIKEFANEIIKKFSDYVKVLNNKDAEMYAFRGNLHAALGEFEAARLDYDMAIANKYHNSEIYCSRGIVNEALHNLNAAKNDFEQAIQLNKNNLDAYFSRGRILLDEGNFKLAILDFDRVIERDNNYVSAYLYRGIAKSKAKNFSEAIFDFTKALEKDPQSVAQASAQISDIYFFRGVAYFESQQYKKAIEDFDRALNLDPNFDRGIYAYRGQAKYYESDLLHAISDIERAQERTSNDANLYYISGRAKQKIHYFEGAALDYKKALAIDPNHKEAKENVDYVQHKLNRIAEIEVSITDFWSKLKEYTAKFNSDCEKLLNTSNSSQVKVGPKEKITNLVFSGGGAAGCAYLGVLDSLNAIAIKNKESFSFNNLKNVAGASIGGLTALMVSLKYSPEEAKSLLDTINFNDLIIHKNAFQKTKIYQFFKLIHDYRKKILIQNNHVCDGKVYRDIVKKIIEKKIKDKNPEEVTFKDLADRGFINLHIVVSKVCENNGKPDMREIRFCAKDTPNTSVLSAVRASGAAPYYFEPIKMKELSTGHFVECNDGDTFVDGGMLNNYPIEIFDEDEFKINSGTLGFVLLSESQIKTELSAESKIGSDIDHILGMVNGLIFEVEKLKLLSKSVLDRTIQIDRLGVDLADFDKLKEKKPNLIASGRRAVMDYFNTAHILSDVGAKQPSQQIKEFMKIHKDFIKISTDQLMSLTTDLINALDMDEPIEDKKENVQFLNDYKKENSNYVVTGEFNLFSGKSSKTALDCSIDQKIDFIPECKSASK